MIHNPTGNIRVYNPYVGADGKAASPKHCLGFLRRFVCQQLRIRHEGRRVFSRRPSRCRAIAVRLYKSGLRLPTIRKAILQESEELPFVGQTSCWDLYCFGADFYRHALPYVCAFNGGDAFVCGQYAERVCTRRGRHARDYLRLQATSACWRKDASGSRDTAVARGVYRADGSA